MALSDKTLTCADCGNEFTFTAGEQEFFASRGFTNEPRRCPQDREARRSQQRGSGPREMHPVVCARCGGLTLRSPLSPVTTDRSTEAIASAK